MPSWLLNTLTYYSTTPSVVSSSECLPVTRNSHVSNKRILIRAFEPHKLFIGPSDKPKRRHGDVGD